MYNLFFKDNIFYYCGDVHFCKHSYETLYDSNGNPHQVTVDFKPVHARLSIDNYNLIDNRYYELKVNDIELEITKVKFQYMLTSYTIVAPDNKINSAYDTVYNLVNFYWIDFFNKKGMFKIVPKHYSFDDLKYAFNIYEVVFRSGNGYIFENLLSDKFFFNYPDKKDALNKVDYHSSRKLKKLGYLDWNTNDTLNFMNKRFNEKIWHKSVYPMAYK